MAAALRHARGQHLGLDGEQGGPGSSPTSASAQRASGRRALPRCGGLSDTGPGRDARGQARRAARRGSGSRVRPAPGGMRSAADGFQMVLHQLAAFALPPLIECGRAGGDGSSTSPCQMLRASARICAALSGRPSASRVRARARYVTTRSTSLSPGLNTNRYVSRPVRSMVPSTAATRSAVRNRERWERRVFIADGGGSSQSRRSNSSMLTLPGVRSVRTVRSSRVFRSSLTAAPSASTIDAAPRTHTFTETTSGTGTNLRPQPDHISTTSGPRRRSETIRNMTTTHYPSPRRSSPVSPCRDPHARPGPCHCLLHTRVRRRGAPMRRSRPVPRARRSSGSDQPPGSRSCRPWDTLTLPGRPRRWAEGTSITSRSKPDQRRTRRGSPTPRRMCRQRRCRDYRRDAGAFLHRPGRDGARVAGFGDRSCTICMRRRG